MEGRRDRQHHAALAAALGRQRHSPLDRRLVARDHHLARRVVIGRNADLGADRRLLRHLAHRLQIEAENRRHGTDPDRYGLLHRLAAAAQKPGGIAQLEAARGRQRRVLAQGMAGHEVRHFGQRLAAVPLDHPDRRKRDRHQRGLGILREGQIALGALEHQTRQALFQRIVQLFEHQTGGLEGLGQLTAHADLLAALAGKDEGAFRHRCSETNPDGEALSGGRTRRPEAHRKPVARIRRKPGSARARMSNPHRPPVKHRLQSKSEPGGQLETGPTTRADCEDPLAGAGPQAGLLGLRRVGQSLYSALPAGPRGLAGQLLAGCRSPETSGCTQSARAGTAAGCADALGRRRPAKQPKGVHRCPTTRA